MPRHKAPFKFVTHGRILADHCEDATDLEFEMAQWDEAAPCDDPGFPPREGGEYWVRMNSYFMLPGYLVYLYFSGRWWMRTGYKTAEEAESTFGNPITLTEVEQAALDTLLRIGRRKWLDPAVARMLHRIECQQAYRESYTATMICLLRPDEEEDAEETFTPD